jgi:lipid-A-disaccharide synthase
MNALRVAIVAGESSGDALGAALIAALRERTDIEVRGVAGPAMRNAGCEALADAHELAVMGLIEPLKHLPRLWRLRSMLLRELISWQPDVFIGVDAPAFNLNLAARFKRHGIATVQYVSPQIWAWRQGRVRTIARRCDLVLCLLPFEPPFYERHAVRARFVGHPLADQVPLVIDHAAARAALTASTGRGTGLNAVLNRPLLLALLPGSRVTEVQRLARPFLETAALLAQHHPDLQVIAPMANSAAHSEFARALAQHPGTLRVQVLVGQASRALAAADVALVASGTATLEALLCRCPMVVAYRVNAATAFLLRTLRLVRLPRFALPNLLAGHALVPEFFQEAAIPANLCAAVERELAAPAERAAMQQEFDRIHRTLRAGGAGRAADEVLALLAAHAAGIGRGGGDGVRATV